MIRVVCVVVVLLASSPLLALTPEECSTVGQAHELLLEGSFEVERTFLLTVNGKLKNRELAHLTYSADELETEVLEYEAFSKIWVHDNEGKDFVLEIAFACERMETTGEGRYELTSEDGLEFVDFELDDESGVLRPISWRTEDTARFLFKKFKISASADYSDFLWR